MCVRDTDSQRDCHEDAPLCQDGTIMLRKETSSPRKEHGKRRKSQNRGTVRSCLCCGGGEDDLMRLQGVTVCQGWGRYGQIQGFVMGISNIKGVMKRHFEGVAAPTKAILDKQARKLGPVVEVCCRNL